MQFSLGVNSRTLRSYSLVKELKRMFKFSSISNLIFDWSNWLFETNHFGAASAGFSGVPVVLLPANHNVFDNVRRKNRKYEYKARIN